MIPFDENNPIPAGHISESMFFKPRSSKYPYVVQEGDLFLVNTPGGQCWIPVGFYAGMTFLDAVEKSPYNIVTIAIPYRFEFDKDDIFSLNIYTGWSATGMGFGQLQVRLDKTTGEIRLDTECMGKVTTRKMLHALVDYIVDNGVSDDWNREETTNGQV